MKVLLVYPPQQHHMLGETPHTLIEPEAGFYPPIGLMYLASSLEARAAHEIRIVDAVAERLPHDQLAARIGAERPDVVGVYASTHYWHDSILTARHAKAASPRTVTVVGGPHVKLYPAETVRVPEIDFAIEGDAERVFVDFLERVDADRERPDVEGLPGVITEATATSYAPAVVPGDLDALPFPARHLVDRTRYRSILARRQPITTVITSRGCPFRCHFCSNLESGQRVRMRSAENVVAELIETVARFGIRDFLIFDELFTVNRKRVLRICEEIRRAGLRIRWHCRSRADVIDAEMARAMKAAGCRLVQLGIETGSPRLQRYINKNLDLEETRHVVELLARTGIQVYADFIVGLPTETPEETRATIAFAKRLPLDYAVFSMYVPFYDSAFYEMGLAQGWHGDFFREFVANPSVPVPDASWNLQDAATYYDIVSRAYHEFYFRPSYIARRLWRLDSPAMAWRQARSAVRVFWSMVARFARA